MGRKIMLIAVLAVVVCTLVIPRYYYQVPSATDFNDIVHAIYATTAIEIAALGALIAFKKWFLYKEEIKKDLVKTYWSWILQI